MKQILYGKGIELKLSGNEVYHKNITSREHAV